MWPDEESQEPSLETLMTEEDIPVGEEHHPSPHKRVFVPAGDVTWEFEIVLETTPYGGEDDV